MRPENLVYMQNGVLKENDGWNAMSVIFSRGIRVCYESYYISKSVATIPLSIRKK